MRKKDNNVYILHSSYKDYDQDMICAYKSMKSLCRGFADVIANECLVDFGEKDENSDLSVMVKKVARKVARLLPDLLKVDFCEDECRDGKTVYGYETIPVESDECDKEEDDGEEDEKDNEEQEG